MFIPTAINWLVLYSGGINAAANNAGSQFVRLKLQIVISYERFPCSNRNEVIADKTRGAINSLGILKH